MCLILALPGAIDVESRLARFFSNDIARFVSTGPVDAEALFLDNHVNALEAGEGDQTFSDLAEWVTGNRLDLDPAMANGDRSAWPLSEDQVMGH